jgi:hypothetical protein
VKIQVSSLPIIRSTILKTVTLKFSELTSSPLVSGGEDGGHDSNNKIQWEMKQKKKLNEKLPETLLLENSKVKTTLETSGED